MNKLSLLGPEAARNAITDLFRTKPPILVEVRFPGSATSPDWHLCEDEEDLEPILERLSPGVELHFSSVWDLKNVGSEVRVVK